MQFKNKDDITSEWFVEFLTIQKSGKYNMHDPRVRNILGLDKESYMMIMGNYDYLHEKFDDCNLLEQDTETGDEEISVSFQATITYEGTEKWGITQNEYNDMSDSEKEELHQEIYEEVVDNIHVRGDTDCEIEIDHTGEEISY
tara:strand:+ start:1226 stop:1654 length:429 start_codon:yes stop_codon:yes gene_type:complete